VTVPKLPPLKCEDQVAVFVEALEFAYEVYQVEAAGGAGAWRPSLDVVERLGPLATLAMDLEALDRYQDADD